MKIYLAGGFSVSNVKGRELALANKFIDWKRLYSYHFQTELHNSEILKFAKNENRKNNS